MIVTEDEATELKKWVVKKLEDISDADSDVLADYVLALIRADTPEPELRLNAIENLEDFLKDNTETFVDAIFLAIHSKSYLPDYVPRQSSPTANLPFSTSPAGVDAYSLNVSGPGAYDGFNKSRKRSYQDRADDGSAIDSNAEQSQRQAKQMRRGVGRNGRADSTNARAGRGGYSLSMTSPNASQGPPPNLPNFPIPPPSLPFDPSNSLATMMTLQAMGLPAFPPIPPLPQAISSTDSSDLTAQPPPFPGLSPERTINPRCRDYDTRGYCTMGDSCPFEHGQDRMVVPAQEEYDPKNSLMTDIVSNPNAVNGHNSFKASRTNGFGRGLGRGRGRGDRGGHASTRRSRADFSHIGPNNDQTMTTVVVEQIPEANFSEPSVRDFFSGFGNIKEITMQAYKHLALVKFEDYAGARRAYDSPKVIFNNRFVKVYWYKPEGADSSSPIPKIEGTKAGDHFYDKAKYEQDALAAQKKLEEKKVLLRETEAKRQALEKQREELAQRQAEEKRKLQERLAAKGVKEDEDTDMKPRTDGSENDNVSAQTKALRAQVAALEAEAKSLGLDHALSEDPRASRGRGRGRGRGSYRGWEAFSGRGFRGRGSFRGGRGGGAYNLDNRTKKVGVSGIEFTNSVDEALRQYLLGIGEFEAIEPHPDRADMQVITFKDRYTAEQFIYGPKEIPSAGKVDFSWVNTPLPSAAAVQSFGDRDTGMTNASLDGDNHADKGAGEVDYDVAEEDDRWMVE